MKGGVQLWEEAPARCRLAPASCLGLPNCLTQEFPQVFTFLPFSGPGSMPTFTGLLEVSIQDLLGQWVKLEGCPCPDQTMGPTPFCSLQGQQHPPPFQPPLNPPLGAPSFTSNEDMGTAMTRC